MKESTLNIIKIFCSSYNTMRYLQKAMEACLFEPDLGQNFVTKFLMNELIASNDESYFKSSSLLKQFYIKYQNTCQEKEDEFSKKNIDELIKKLRNKNNTSIFLDNSNTTEQLDKNLQSQQNNNYNQVISTPNYPESNFSKQNEDKNNSSSLPEINSIHFKQFETLIKTNETALNSFISENKSLQENINQIKIDINHINDIKNEIQNNNNEMQTSIQLLQESIKLYQTDLSSLLNFKFNELEEKINNLLEDKSNNEILIEEMKKKLQSYEITNSNLENIIQELQKKSELFKTTIENNNVLDIFEFQRIDTPEKRKLALSCLILFTFQDQDIGLTSAIDIFNESLIIYDNSNIDQLNSHRKQFEEIFNNHLSKIPNLKNVRVTWNLVGKCFDPSMHRSVSTSKAGEIRYVEQPLITDGNRIIRRAFVDL